MLKTQWNKHLFMSSTNLDPSQLQFHILVLGIIMNQMNNSGGVVTACATVKVLKSSFPTLRLPLVHLLL